MKSSILPDIVFQPPNLSYQPGNILFIATETLTKKESTLYRMQCVSHENAERELRKIYYNFKTKD